MKNIVLVTSLAGEQYDRICDCFHGAEVNQAFSLQDVERLADQNSVLLTFATGMIIPARMINVYCSALNLHAASPEFPGRDPHHHAVYAGARRYGATLHRMEASVDSGQIIDVEWIDVPNNCRPSQLLALADAAGLRLLERYGAAISSGQQIPCGNFEWGDYKTKRSDLVRMSGIDRFVGPDEFLRRFRAFDGEEYNNLTSDFYGHRFRIEKEEDNNQPNHDDLWATFTEGGYRNILNKLVEGGYAFADYHTQPSDPHVIWRHDVDYSLQRARWCAEIEAEFGAKGTYFINPRCTFYNLLEPANLRCVERIAELGHEVGLHFDAPAMNVQTWDLQQLEGTLGDEARLFEKMTGIEVRTVSWHNPTLSNLLEFDDEKIAGLVNAYSRFFRENYVYCSDSNGYWRFKPMLEVIEESHARLHLLTHPAWWTPTALPPRMRIERAVAGRAAEVMRDYDETLEKSGRENLR